MKNKMSALTVLSIIYMGCDSNLSVSDEPSALTAIASSAVRQETAPACGGQRRVYKGLLGLDLTASRIAKPAGSNRVRTLDAQAIEDRLSRFFGHTPEGMEDLRQQIQPERTIRWSPSSLGPIVLSPLFDTLAKSCVQKVASEATKFAAEPSASTARETCVEWMTQAWDLEPNEEEIDTCVKFAVEDTASTTAPLTGSGVLTPTVQRWAHACTAILMSAQFTSSR